MLSNAALGNRDYVADAWSSDYMLTNTTDSHSRYKNMLSLTELSDGRFNFLYETGMGTTEYYSFTESDKLGGSIRQGPAVAFPGWLENMGWSITQREWTYTYDEGHGTFNFVAQEDFHTIGFYKFSRNGTLLFHRSLDYRDMNLEPDPIHTDIYLRLEGCQDWLGRTHVVMATWTPQSNASNYICSIRLIYLQVAWNPFKINYQVIWQSPYQDTEPWQNAPRQFTISPWPLITVGQSNEVIVLHVISEGSTFYRAFSIRDIAGNWTTHKICKSTDPAYGLFLTASGLHVDNRSRIHATWFDRGLSSLVYVCMDELGNMIVEPWALNLLPVNVFNIAIRTSIGVTDEGHTLIAFNIVPYTSAEIVDPPYPNHIKSEIRLVVVRDADINHRDYSIIKLVSIPSASECYLYIDDVENIYLFWFDQRTGKTQLYMKYLAHPGISLEIDPYDWANARFIRPNEAKVLPIRLRNVGSVELDAAIYVESNASVEWDLQLSDYRAHLKLFETMPVNLSVYCPPSAKYGESIEVWINATTSDKEYSSQIRLLMFVTWNRRLEVTCRPTFHLTEPGKDTRYRVVLQNNGDIDETVHVNMVGIGPPGWSLGPGNITLAMRVHDIRSIDVTVTAPENAYADEAHAAQLDFFWGDSIMAAPRLILRTVVRPTFFVTMEVNRTRAVLRPGETAAFRLTVGNAGNLPGNAYVEVSTLTDPGEWLVILSKETVVLGPGTSEDLELLLGAPADARGGAIMVVRIRAYCPNPFSEVTMDVSAEVEHLLSFAMDVPELSWDLAPHSSGWRGLNITSHGNLFEVVDFRLDGLESGWLWWLRSVGVETRTITIGPNGTVEVEVWLRVPADASARRHLLRLYLEAEGITVGYVDLVVQVRQVRELSVTSNPMRSVAYPGGHIEMSVVVRNLGNGDDLVALCASAPGVVDLRFLMDGANTTLLWLPRGESRTLILWARIADDAMAGKSELWISSSSTEDAKVMARGNAAFEVVMPSLRVSRVELDPQRPKAGEIVVVRVLLLNAGPVEVVNVAVTMPGAEPEVVTSIPPDGEATTTFVWVASGSGNVNLEGRVNFGPGNNTVPWTRMVTMNKKTIDRSWDLALLAVATASFSLILVTAVLRWKGSKANSDSLELPNER